MSGEANVNKWFAIGGLTSITQEGDEFAAPAEPRDTNGQIGGGAEGVEEVEHPGMRHTGAVVESEERGVGGSADERESAVEISVAGWPVAEGEEEALRFAEI